MFIMKLDDKIWLSPAAVVQSLNRFLIPCNSLDWLSFQINLTKAVSKKNFPNLGTSFNWAW